MLGLVITLGISRRNRAVLISSSECRNCWDAVTARPLFERMLIDSEKEEYPLSARILIHQTREQFALMRRQAFDRGANG